MFNYYKIIKVENWKNILNLSKEKTKKTLELKEEIFLKSLIQIQRVLKDIKKVCLFKTRIL